VLAGAHGEHNVRERTGEETAIGATNVAFGAMGVVLSALLFTLGPELAADMQNSSERSSAGEFVVAMPATDVTSLGLEIARVATWIAIIVAGVLMLRMSRWSRPANLVCGAAFLAINAAKIVEGGFSFIDFGFASYGMALIAFLMLMNWRMASEQAGAISRERDPLVTSESELGEGATASNADEQTDRKAA